MAAGSLGVKNVTLTVNTSDIKKFNVIQSVFSTGHIVRCHVIKFAELAWQLDMSFISQVSGVNDDYAVLHSEKLVALNGST
jgi:hypothetical protein